ncbi:MAG: alkane 1-monooxygenase [Flavobacteriales bacterium]|nr:alkane 1-monooxygenase [Flavobacteriales bacterium]
MARLKYFLAFSLPLVTLLSVHLGNLWSFGTLVQAFFLIPLLELLLAPDKSGPSSYDEEKMLSTDRFYDFLLYAMVPMQYAGLSYYLYRVSMTPLETYEVVGMTLSIGVQCGAVGINVAHELGHRKSKFERTLARMLLLSSLYMHFIVEHNRGHHKNVGTPLDPASARLNEPVYTFWIRTIIGSFRSAWNIERRLLERSGSSHWSIRNEMVQVVLVEFTLIAGVYLVFGFPGLFGFLLSSLIGIVLLETVNYIEHYGLRRKEVSEGRYERVQPWHSWNSDYPLGRIMLFELTRHSDHHYKASKKYQVLNHLDQSPQLPAGYPGMMLLSLVPPLWFRIVNPRVEQINRLRQ